MHKSELKRFEVQARIMKALSHPTRLFIVHELGKGERCVCEITAMVGADVSTVSKHLAIMKKAGIVHCDKRGTSVFYSLAMTCALNFFSCANEVIRKQAEEHVVSV